MREFLKFIGKEPKECVKNNLIKQLDQLEVGPSVPVRMKVDR